MSVSSSTSRAQFNCNSSTVDFDFTFGVGATSEIQVIYTTDAGVETVLTETTHYTVSATNDDYSAGGRVTTVATYATGTTITILRNVPLTQETDFTEGMATLYETFEDGLDKLTRIAQQFNEELNRMLILKKSDDTTVSMELPLKADRASKYLAFDSDGEPMASSGPAGSSDVPVSAAMEPVLEAATVAAAMLLLMPGGTARQAIQMNAGATALEFVTSLAGLLTAQGDIIYASAANTPARLAKGTSLQNLRMNSAATAPEWTSADFRDASGMADLGYSGPYTTLRAGADLAFGDVCYMASTGKMVKGDANAIATSGIWGMALGTIATDAYGAFLLPGSFVRNEAWTWATVGSFLYLSASTAGAMTQTPPSGTDDAIQIIGIVTNAKRLFFCPQLLMYTHV